MVKHPCPFSCPCCQSFQGIDTLVTTALRPGGIFQMHVTSWRLKSGLQTYPSPETTVKSMAQISTKASWNGQVACKRTLGLRYFPTIAAHRIEDWKSILLAATFGPLHTVANIPYGRMLSPYVLATRNTRLPKWTSSKLTSRKVKFRAYGSW